MTTKAHILDALGEEALVLPAQLAAALGANDRAKYDFTLLQFGRAHAEHPQAPLPDFAKERLAAGQSDDSLDTVMRNACALGDGRYRMPGAQALCTRLRQALDEMLRPLRSAGLPAATGFAERLQALDTPPWCEADEVFSDAAITRLVSGERERGDSLHLLVMDLHKALNALQAQIACEHILGAACYALAEVDRPRVSAFMHGVQRTARLKFDHPGLGTTATRAGERLLIQNDIGTTDAHVLVIQVQGLSATLTYTDVHLQRLIYFQGLFADWAVDWEDTRSRADASMEDGLYHLGVGVYQARDEDDLCAYLRFLGSRLVFLIDWNRARKRLRLLLPKRETLTLLDWAAHEEYGHMAFLRMGGEAAIFDALSFVAQEPGLLGRRLDELLGVKAAAAYMQFVLRTCAEGLLARRAVALVRDELRAELVNYLHSAQQRLHDLAAEHAAWCFELANSVRDSLFALGAADAGERLGRMSARAVDWEHQADALLDAARERVRHAEKGHFYYELLMAADDVADELEEALFHLTLVGATPVAPPLKAALQSLSQVLLEGCQDYVRAIEACRSVHRGGAQTDMQDFLEAVHRIVSAEHRSDAAHRGFKVSLVACAPPTALLYALSECARNLESGADALMHAALDLHDHVLAEVIAE